MVDVKKEGKYIIVKSKLGTLIYGPDFMSYNPPIEGFYEHGMIVTKNGMVELVKKPPLRVKENGIEHVLIAIDEYYQPVYAVEKDNDILITTTDFKMYKVYVGLYPRILKDEEVKKIIRRKKENNGSLKTFDKHAVLLHDNGIKIYEVTDEGLNELFELKVPPDRVTSIHEEKWTSTLYISFKNNVTLEINGEKIFDKFDNEIDAESATVLAKMKSIEEISEWIDNDPAVKKTGADVIEVINKLRKHPGVFGPHVAVLSKNRILTRRGIIKMNVKKPKLSDGEKRILEYVLYMNDRYETLQTKNITFHVQVYSDYIKVNFKKMRIKTLKIGKYYYWTDTSIQSDERYRGNAGFLLYKYGSNHPVINKGKIHVYFNTLLPPQAVEKLSKGEKISKEDLVPGGEAIKTFKSKTIETEKKSINYRIAKYEENGIWMRVPFVEGLYKVFIPYGSKTKCLDAMSIKEVDMPAEPIIELPFMVGAPVKRISYDRYNLTYTLEDREIVVHTSKDKPTKIIMNVGNRRIKFENEIDILLGMNSWKDFQFFISMM